jgi:hypothetical protein
LRIGAVDREDAEENFPTEPALERLLVVEADLVLFFDFVCGIAIDFR